MLLVACAVVLGWRVNRARKNRERVAPVRKAVVEIQRLGGRVYNEAPSYFDGNYYLDEGSIQERWSATWLETLLDDPGDGSRDWKVRIVKLDGTDVTDAEMEHLIALTTLVELNLNDSHVTDAGLEHLKGLEKLRALELGNTDVTDAGLQHLKELKELVVLELYGTKVTDAGLEQIKEMKLELLFLSLSGTIVTDAGLGHLRGLANLRELWLQDTKVTAEGVKKLQQALPNCKVRNP